MTVSEHNPEVHLDTLASGASISLVGRVLGRVLLVGVQVFLARMLGVHLFGLYAIGYTLFSMIAIFVPLGMDFGVINFASKDYGKNDAAVKGVLIQTIGSSLFSGVFLGMACFLLASPVAVDIFHKPELVNIIRAFSLAIPFVALLRVIAAATRITHRVKYSILSEELLQPFSALILVGLFYWMGYGVIGSVIANAVSFLLATGVIIYFFISLFSTILSKPGKLFINYKELYVYAIPLAFAAILNAYLMWASRLSVGYFLPAASAAVFQAASQASSLFGIIVGGFTAILSPLIAHNYHQGNMGQLKDIYRVSTKWGLYLSLPIIIICFVAPVEILSFLFGPQYGVGKWVFVILVASQLVIAAVGDVGTMLVMTKHQNNWLALSASGMLICLVLNFSLIPSFGLIGAALATAAGFIWLFFGGMIRIWVLMGIWPYDRRYFKGIVAALSSLGASLLIKHFLISDFSPLVILSITSVGTFVILLLALGLDQEDKNLLGFLWKRIRSIF